MNRTPGRAGRWKAVLAGTAVVAACLTGCAGRSQGYRGIPQPAYSQVDYFQPGHEEELKAEATRIRQAAQLPPYEEGSTVSE